MRTNATVFRYILALLLCLTTTARAADLWPCVDTDNNGAFDVACPGSDANLNGIPADGLETTPLVYLQMWTASGCSAGSYRKLTAANTFTACVDPVAVVQCEATGTGVCKYINPTTGNDGNSGTYLSPWRTWRMVSNYANPANRPTGWYQPLAGDVIYQVGGTASDIYSTGEGGGSNYPANAVAFINGIGTQANPITLREYPGTNAIMNTSDTATCLSSYATSTWLRFYGFDVTQCQSNPVNIFGDDHVLSGLDVHDSNALGNSGNNGGIRFHTTNRVKFNHNRVYNIYDSNGQVENTRMLVEFDSKQLEVNYNYFYHTCDPTSGSCPVASNGVGTKGGADTPNAGFTFVGNQMWHINGPAIRNSTADAVITNNFIRNTTFFCFDQTDQTHGYYPKNTTFERNSCIRTAGCWNYKPGQASPLTRTGPVSIQNNICVDRFTSYGGDNTPVRIDPYSGQAAYDYTFLNVGRPPGYPSANYLTLNNNCYWRNNGTATASTANFGNIFSPGYAPPGGYFTFTNYQAHAVIDEAASTFVNPALDTYDRAAHASCDTFGALAISAAPTPTPTPAPTASPTPAPGQTSAARWRVTF